MSKQPDLFVGTPYAKGSETSMQAAVSIASDTASLRARVFGFIKRQRGATCWEIERELGMRHQTASARIRELFLQGALIDGGLRRRTGSGRNAVVWEIPVPP